jgi:hypothetical protein
MPADYEVGYGRPPSHTRFQKGRSGNPKGRPKGARNFGTELQEALGQTVLVREGGVARRVTRRGAVVLSLLAKALKGDVRAAALLIAAEQRADAAKQGAPDGEALSADEAEVMAGFEARLRERLRREQGAENPGGEPAP